MSSSARGSWEPWPRTRVNLRISHGRRGSDENGRWSRAGAGRSLGFMPVVVGAGEKHAATARGIEGHERQLVQRTSQGARRVPPAAFGRPRPTGVPPEGAMTSDLEKLMANLSDSDRDRLNGAFAADPE